MMNLTTLLLVLYLSFGPTHAANYYYNNDDGNDDGNGAKDDDDYVDLSDDDFDSASLMPVSCVN